MNDWGGVFDYIVSSSEGWIMLHMGSVMFDYIGSSSEGWIMLHMGSIA